MVKTFHDVNRPAPSEPAADPAIRTFHDQAPKPAAPAAAGPAAMFPAGATSTTPAAPQGTAPAAAAAQAAAAVQTFHHLPAREAAPRPVPPRVLFADRAVTAEAIDAQWREATRAALADCDCADFTPDDPTLQRIRMMAAEIRFDDAVYQTRYASDVAETLRQLQDELARKIGDGAIGRLQAASRRMLEIVRGIDLDALDSHSVSGRLADWWKGRDARRAALRAEFEAAGGAIEREIAGTRADLAALGQRLAEFGTLYARNETVFELLTVHLAAAHLRLRQTEAELPARRAALAGVTDPFARQAVDALEDAAAQWRRKLDNLRLLRHTTLLTLPQLRLTQRNLHATLNRFGDMIDVLLPAWKQQFITALALPESDDGSLFDRLVEIQASLRKPMEELFK
ncbi:toxic anion resistance protein [Chitinimonas koreensis]|uniref:toxic anion resistance protein n=1 Tax=Chitinimonas koreensis TaxID=356302 RepID=UPI00040FEAD6|nr:toxic anion resistance protein [Chitinimonas koreensis]QNM98174.1 toxic anion resistance protein [Chitinimonas koreensis]